MQMERGGLREEIAGRGPFQQLGAEGEELFFRRGGETGLWREGKGIFADGKGRFAGRDCGAGAIPAAGSGGRGAFLPAGVKLGCGEKGKGSLQMERGGLREEIAGRGLFQQLGPQEGQELFLPAGDLDLGHGEEGSGLCLSEVFEVAEGQELPVLFVQPL